LYRLFVATEGVISTNPDELIVGFERRSHNPILPEAALDRATGSPFPGQPADESGSPTHSPTTTVRKLVIFPAAEIRVHRGLFVFDHIARRRELARRLGERGIATKRSTMVLVTRPAARAATMAGPS
jgi:hypothetical protein